MKQKKIVQAQLARAVGKHPSHLNVWYKQGSCPGMEDVLLNYFQKLSRRTGAAPDQRLVGQQSPLSSNEVSRRSVSFAGVLTQSPTTPIAFNGEIGEIGQHMPSVRTNEMDVTLAYKFDEGIFDDAAAAPESLSPSPSLKYFSSDQQVFLPLAPLLGRYSPLRWEIESLRTSIYPYISERLQKIMKSMKILLNVSARRMPKGKGAMLLSEWSI